jgi:hypothetical protein
MYVSYVSIYLLYICVCARWLRRIYIYICIRAHASHICILYARLSLCIALACVTSLSSLIIYLSRIACSCARVRAWRVCPLGVCVLCAFCFWLVREFLGTVHSYARI